MHGLRELPAPDQQGPLPRQDGHVSDALGPLNANQRAESAGDPVGHDIEEQSVSLEDQGRQPVDVENEEDVVYVDSPARNAEDTAETDQPGQSDHSSREGNAHGLQGEVQQSLGRAAAPEKDPDQHDRTIAAGAELAIGRTLHDEESSRPSGDARSGQAPQADARTEQEGGDAELIEPADGGNDGGDDVNHTEKQAEPPEPLNGVVKGKITENDLSPAGDTLEIPALRSKLYALRLGELLLISGASGDAAGPQTAEFIDEPAMSRGHDVHGPQDVRMGTLTIGEENKPVVLKSYDEISPYYDDTTGVDMIVEETGMATSINNDELLRSVNIRAVRPSGYWRYATGAVDSESGEPVSKIAMMMEYESTAVTYERYLWGLDDVPEEPSEEKLEEVVDKAADTIGCVHHSGRIHGDPDGDNMMLDLETGDTVLADFESAQTFAEAKAQLADGIGHFIRVDLERFVSAIERWRVHGGLSRETTDRLIGRFNDGYRYVANGHGTAIPPEDRIRDDEVIYGD
jgi:hypothetical protein